MLRSLAHWFCRPGRPLLLDGLSDHMLRDIGIDPSSAREESSSGYWRQR